MRAGRGSGADPQPPYREVSHVHPQVRADLVSNRAERSEVQLTGVRGPAGNNQLGALSQSQFTHLLHVNAVGLVHAVRDNVVQLAGDVQLHAVGQVVPCARDRPMMVSPGFSSACITALFACAPEWG